MKLLLENWKRFLKEEQTRTLYHGTLIDNLDSIKKYGVQSGFGGSSFVDHYYDEDDEQEEFVYFADKHTLSKALTAMIFHISKKLNKNFHDVSEKDIKKHGLLIIAKNVDIEDSYADPENTEDWAEFRGVESEDYYFSSLNGDIYLIGNKLVSFLRNKNLIPLSGFGQTIEGAREQLIKLALRQFKDIPRQEIINKIKNLDNREIKYFLRQHQEEKSNG